MAKVVQWLNTGIYPGTILFSCGFPYDELFDLLKKKKAADWWRGIQGEKELIESGNYFALHRLIRKEGVDVNLFYIIINEQFNFSDYEYCKLAHEVLHICQFHLPAMLDRNREWESEAYLHTHIMQQCLKAIRG